jgi:hypothetical protein
MGVALLKKNTGGKDPRAGLRQALAARTAAEAKVEQRQQAIHRAQGMVREAEAKVTGKFWSRSCSHWPCGSARSGCDHRTAAEGERHVEGRQVGAGRR